MPWKEQNVVDQRKEFVTRAFEKKKPFVELCEEFGIPPKTGYKWKKRFEQFGWSGLEDASRRPKNHPTQLSEVVICEIIRIKINHRHWGPRKIRKIYERNHRGEELPSESSFKRVCEKAGLVKKRKRRKVTGTKRISDRREPTVPNDVWTVDFKGWWRSADLLKCEPLTVRDLFSRYLLTVKPLEDGKTETVRGEFERLFERYGLPKMIRSDNGPPFACTRGLCGLTRLAAWWVSLGIELDRITPGCPQENGAHERMHRDISMEIQREVDGDWNTSRNALELWRREYNEVRPHEALDMATPASVYRKSKRKYRGSPERIEYPLGWYSRRIRKDGYLKFKGDTIFISSTLRGYEIGLRNLGDGRFELMFCDLRLGVLDPRCAVFVAETAQTTEKAP